MTKNMTVTFRAARAALAALALAAVPVAIPSAAHADVCGDVGGRHVSVGGCTPGVAGDVAAGAAVAGAEDAAVAGSPEYQAATGQPPCYTPEGQPYWTPGDAPCY